MSVAIVTGSAGLVGSESVRYFAEKGLEVVGIDNDLRSSFFGPEASTMWMRKSLLETVKGYQHYSFDIRDRDSVVKLFQRYANDIALVIHCAAQPSHDWAATNPTVDLEVNTVATSIVLEATRQSAPDSVFIYMSTNKVYGDGPNELPFVELPTRWEVHPDHAYSSGIPETMSVDGCLHSLFGVSKLAADVLVQEYGRYFGMHTVCFRGGCLTGPNHSGTELHGFLAYLVKCVLFRKPYRIYGYVGKQVRDNIHSSDLIRAFDQFFMAPRCGETYNIGGGRFSNCSMEEAIAEVEDLCGQRMLREYIDEPRRGDHRWWISDCSKFRSHYPEWEWKYDVPTILQDIYESSVDRMVKAA
jgi:CDP-paratose 2-epimerase